MSDERMDEMLDRVRETYNVPEETPRKAMWEVISGRLEGGGADVVDLAVERERRAAGSPRMSGWAVAAAALLVLGIGIGRMTAPAGAPAVPSVVTASGADVLSLATWEHLGRTESLLTMVRADVRRGRVDPVTVGMLKWLIVRAINRPSQWPEIST